MHTRQSRIVLHVCGYIAFGVSVLLSPAVSHAQQAQNVAAPVRPAYSDFFELAQPRFDVVAFAGAYRSDQYATIQEGFQFEQTVTPYIGLVARATGYQLFEGAGFQNPLSPSDSAHQARLNFGRFQGGLDLSPYPGTYIYLLGGKDVADSHAYDLEADFSSWLFSYSPHPVNFSFETGYDGQNNVTSSAIDLRMVLFSRGSYMVFAGGGGAIWNGGFIEGGLAGEGGPDVGAYLTKLKIGLDVQAGYGTSGGYVQVTCFKLFSFNE